MMAGAVRTSPSPSRGEGRGGGEWPVRSTGHGTDIITAVAKYLSIEPDRIIGPSKERTIGKARALVCYWAVRELGMTMTEVAKPLKIAPGRAKGDILCGEAFILS